MNYSAAVLLSIVVSSLVLAGCGKGDLKLGDATAQLLDHLAKSDRNTSIVHMSNDDTKLWRFECSYDQGCPKEPQECFLGCPNQLVKLKQKGLVRIEEMRRTPRESVFRPGTVFYKATLTDEGKKYLVKETTDRGFAAVEVKTRQLSGLDIAGIGVPADMRGKKVSTVRYSVKYQMTPFGDKSDASEQVREAYFVLYSDGWKLEAEN